MSRQRKSFCVKGLRLAIISNVAELQRARNLVKRVNEDVWLAGNDMSFESDWRWAIHFFPFLSIIFFFLYLPLDGPMGPSRTTGALLSTLEALSV